MDNQKLTPPEEKDTVTLFMESLAGSTPQDRAQSSLRITEHGLFVEKNYLPEIISAFQKWYHSRTQSNLSEQKTHKKFFTTPSPVLYYLIESKQCMVGHLIRREIKDPRALGLPFYLGSLDDTRRTIHPRDPILLYTSNLEVLNAKGQTEFELTSGKRKWRFSEKVLMEFSRLLQRSPKLAREAPGSTGALRDSLKLIVDILERARPVGPKQRFLVPVRYANRPRIQYLVYGTLTFVIEAGGQVVDCYETGGKTLFRFIKSEFIALHALGADRKHSTVEIEPPRSRYLAEITSRRHKCLVHPRGFAAFLRSIMREPLEHSSLREHFSLHDCLSQYAELFQRAEPIERSKIERHVSMIRMRHALFLINGRWIFVLSKKEIIQACVDRFQSSAQGRGPRQRQHAKR